MKRACLARWMALGVFMAFASMAAAPATGADIGVYNLPGQGATNTPPTITLVPLSAGLYRFTLVTPDIDARASYFAWNPYGSGSYWSTAYAIRFAQVPGGPLTGRVGGEFTFSDTPYHAWLATTNKAVEVDIPFDQDVRLFVDDSVFGDNTGGVSVLVELVAPHVEFRQVSDPVSIVNQTTYPLLGATTSTITAPDPYANYRFTHWTVGGVRMADPTGCGTNPATFVINGPTEAVAHYVPTTQDSDGDGLPDWWELRYFGNLAQGANDDPDGDGFTNATEYANGTRPNVIESLEQGGVSRRRGVAFNVDVGVGDPTWPYGGVSRRRSATVTAVLNTAGYATLTESSTPAGIVSQTRVIAKGSTVNLTIPPDPYADYRFTGWNVNGVRYDSPTQLQPIPITINGDTVAVARYVRQSDDTDGDGIPDWLEWFLFNTLAKDQTSDADGDGFTFAQETVRGYSQVAADALDMGGVSRRRSATFTVDLGGRLPYRLTSDPATILEQTQYLPAGTPVTVPDKKNDNYAGYLFSWWDLNGIRAQDPSGAALTTFSFSLTAPATATAHYINPSIDTVGDGISDWNKMTYYGSLAFGAASDTDGDGFTFAQELLRGFSPRVVDTVAQGGVSRRRSVLVAVNAIFLPNPPAIGANAAINITRATARLSAQVNPVNSATGVYFQWGRTSAYGQNTATQNIGAGLQPVNTFADLTGLAPGTVYHFRVVASNAQGISIGDDFIFQTQQTTYADWAAANGVGAPLVDDDGDGVVNFLEFAFGLNPRDAGAMQLPQPQFVGDNYVVTFAQPAGVSGIIYGAEWSADLTPGSWAPIADTGSGTTHTFSVSIGSNQKMFIRLRVSSP